MKTRSKIALAAPAVVGLAATLLIPISAAADPLAPSVGPCPGSLVGTYNIDSTARLEVWYSSAKGGTNCVKTVSTSAKKKKRYMFVSITAAGTSRVKSDEGYYRYYAGPEIITGTAGKCITVTSKTRTATGTLADRHCG